MGRRWFGALAAAALAIAVTAVLVLVTHTGRKQHPAVERVAVPGPHGLAGLGSEVAAALFDAGAVVRVGENGRIVYRVSVGSHPTNPVVAGNSLWVPVVGDHRLVELNARSGKVERRLTGTYAAAAAGPAGSLVLPTWRSAPAHPKLWRGDAVTRLDTVTGRTIWRRSFGGIVLTVASRDGQVWVPDFAGNRLAVVSAADGATRSEVRLPGRPVAVAVGESCAWVAIAKGSLLRMNPRTRKIEGRTPLHGDNVDYMVAGHRGVWLTRYASPSAAVLEHVSCKSGLVDMQRQVGGASQGLAVGDTHLWVADYGRGEILRLDKQP